MPSSTRRLVERDGTLVPDWRGDGTIQDRGGRDMALAMTHEEVVGDLVRKEIHSYKQLPQSSITIQTKWRDDLAPARLDPRPRVYDEKTRTAWMPIGRLDQQYRSALSGVFQHF